MLIGRKRQVEILDRLCNSNQSEFAVVYGRRRVGKTFLIREYFEHNFLFHHTGLANADTSQQLLNFHSSLTRQVESYTPLSPPNNWLEAFQHVIDHIDKQPERSRKIIFIDEMPWLDTARSDFVTALEHFWNGYLSARKDIILIACGSAASWMIHELINNTGGLYNRVTERIKIEPFDLYQTEKFLQSKDIILDRYQIANLYMVTGGIPFYLERIRKGLSALQNIEQMVFTKNALLNNEYPHLLRSLFKKSENHNLILTALAGKTKGLTRKEIISKTKLPSGGTLTKILDELEESGFISSYAPFSNKKKETIYRIADFYSAFYHRFLKGLSKFEPGMWTNMQDHPSYRAWSGYAFEQLCMDHIEQIKKALGISGILSSSSSWVSNQSDPGAQIDLLIDRRDQVVSICEIKYSLGEYVITKGYAENLRNKIETFRRETGTKKALFLAMITTFGVKQNAYSGSLVQNSITLDDLFVTL